MVSRLPIVVTARWPTYSRRARWIGILAGPWFFAVLFALEALKLSGPAGPPELRWPGLIVALGPGAFALLVPWLGRLRGFRWTHERHQPQLTIREDGLDVQLPRVGSKSYSWDEIAGLRPRPAGDADLLGAGGIVLARLPDSLLVARETWWRERFTAELIARSRPGLVRLSGANWGRRTERVHPTRR